ncbi:MAG: DMT family transporter [Tannerellaceae bacterium]|nr:DMT family transporter [Tannerellaceae bacterium]
MYKGELIALSVAVSWMFSAIFFEIAGKRAGTLSLNILRLGMSIVMIGATTWFYTGHFFPVDAGSQAWFWLGISGVIGYILGDYCLFSSYILIGSRFGQLFMTLAPPSAALAGILILGEQMSGNAIAGMFVTLFGIGLSIVGRGGEENQTWHVSLPLKGILFAIGGGVGQGVGLVFSKLGMDYYLANIPSPDETTMFMIPFASTQIRAIIGFIGFLIVMFVGKRGRAFLLSLKDKKAFSAITGGTIFGPFLGVSFSLMAVQYTAAGIASTLMALTPVIILIPSYFIFKQKISIQEIIGAIISVGGVSLFFI